MTGLLLIGVARAAGLGLHGYGYLFAAAGAGSLAGTALASRALHGPHPRAGLLASLAAVGLPMPLLAVVHAPVLALVLVSLTGVGAILVEIVTDTGLQRMLPGAVFGRAYGLALPASLGGIVAGSLIAPLLTSLIGGTGALLACGAAVVGYALVLLRAPRHAAIGSTASGEPAAPRTIRTTLTRRTAAMGCGRVRLGGGGGSGGAQGGAQFGGGLVQLLVRGRRGRAEVEVVQVPGREDVHVQVRDLQPGDDQPGARGAERRLGRVPDPVRDVQAMVQQRAAGVGPLVHFLARDDQRVPGGQRRDRQESDGLLVGVHEPGRQLAVDDPGEQRGHRSPPAPPGRQSRLPS
jgi:hypothetical protein